MKTIEEYEEEIRNIKLRDGTGIQCPQCGDELLESNPGILLTCNPPKKTVHCPTCKYENYIIV
jgi:hypothetical protein